MPSKIILRRNQTIGASTAELDEAFLKECFVDTGVLEILRECEDPRRIILGRTGSGKSALLTQLRELEDNIIEVAPESLALTYIANSSVLKFFMGAGVELDIFFKLLWRHVFCVEILKERFQIENEVRKKTFLDSLWTLIPRNKKYERGLDYLRHWGESFWMETEYRVKEITTTLEKDLKGSLQGKIKDFATLDAAASRKLTEEERQEVIQRGQEVVNRVQIRELSEILDLMRDVLLQDHQKRYYVVIDRLDEDWTEDTIRLRLIRALIETSIDFARIKQVKIITVLRNDLLDRVYRFTRSTGFQEEKHRSSTLNMVWSRDQLIQLLDRRINHVFKKQYTNGTLSHKDILPEKIGKQRTIDYMLERTLMRPRDLIQFFNLCIERSDSKSGIGVQALREAEGAYSRDRLRALADEWFGLYPNLLQLAKLLKNRREKFNVADLAMGELEENWLEILTSADVRQGIDQALAKMVFDETLSKLDYRKEVVCILHRVGLIGVKLESFEGVSWPQSMGMTMLSPVEITDNCAIFVNKTFWRALGILDSQVAPEINEAK